MRKYFGKFIIASVLLTTVFVGTGLALWNSSLAFADPVVATKLAPSQIGNLTEEKFIIYVGKGCPHCAKVEAYVTEKEYEKAFDLEYKEVYYNRDNAIEYNKEMDRLKVPLDVRGVPLLLVGDRYFIGDVDIVEFLDKQYTFVKPLDPAPDGGAGTDSGEGSGSTSAGTDGGGSSSSVLTISMVVWAALVDAINPCEFAILIILMTTILASDNRKKALKAGLAYSLAIFLSYLAMGLGLYTAVATAGLSSAFMTVIGILAIVLGILNLKDVFFKFGFKMEVPMSWRPKMKAIVQSVASPLGAFVVGLVISLFLIPCTSGPYIVILGMLGSNETFANAVWLLILYNLIFVSPMLFITFAVYGGFSVEKAEEIRKKKMKLMHLIAGAVLVVMGIVILVQYA